MQKERERETRVTPVHGRIVANGDARRFTHESRQTLLCQLSTPLFFFLLFKFLGLKVNYQIENNKLQTSQFIFSVYIL